MNLCILAEPCEDVVFANIGEYNGVCDPEVMIYNEDFVEWNGKVARHFVPIDYYLQFMDGGEELYLQAFGEFDHFAFFEYQDCEWSEFWIDKDNLLVGQWLLLLFKEEEQTYHWFNSEEEAEFLFYFLASPLTQGRIYEQNQSEGSEFPRAVTSEIL